VESALARWTGKVTAGRSRPAKPEGAITSNLDDGCTAP
jgi:hypothetical protein